MKLKAGRDRWEQGFAALRKFRAREGHCRTSRFHVEGNYQLGPWVSVQRYNYKNNTLSVERTRRLEAIGFVWSWPNYLWEQGFTALLKFKRREGHCRVPMSHSEGKFRLGYWVSTQRQNKNEMSAERKARLNKIGFIWKAGTGPNAH
jgi:Helicase associated domain